MKNKLHEKDKEIIIKDRREIVKVITAALVEDNPVQVQFGKEASSYYSRFRVGADRFEEVENGEHLDIAPLDPPAGNIRIRSTPKINLSFFTTSYSVSAQLDFLETTNRRSMRLSFPETLTLTGQKRESVRVDVDPKWDLVVKALRPSGMSFVTKAQDLSFGGICFYSVGAIPMLAEKAKIRLILQWPSEKLKAEAGAIMVKQFTKEGDAFFRARFMFDSHKKARGVEEVVAALQRKHLSRRRKLFEE